MTKMSVKTKFPMTTAKTIHSTTETRKMMVANKRTGLNINFS